MPGAGGWRADGYGATVNATALASSSAFTGTYAPSKTMPMITHDLQLAGTSAGVSFAPRTLYHRVRDAGTITKIGLTVLTEAGNICVAVCRGAAGRAGPTSRVATSGSVACPAAGDVEVSLGGSVEVLPGDWFAIGFDDTTTRVLAVTSGLSPTALALGLTAYENSFPVPATPSTTAAMAAAIIMVGVA